MFNEFIDTSILSTLGGCSLLVTLITQVFKRYLPENIDTKWLALGISIVVGILRIITIGDFSLDGIVSGLVNSVLLLSTSIGIYEVSKPLLTVPNTKSEKEEEDDG